MKVTLNAEKQEFKPVNVTLHIETKDELEVIWRYFNVSSDRQEGIVNEPYNALSKFTSAHIRNVIDPIYTNLNELMTNE